MNTYSSRESTQRAEKMSTRVQLPLSTNKPQKCLGIFTFSLNYRKELLSLAAQPLTPAGKMAAVLTCSSDFTISWLFSPGVVTAAPFLQPGTQTLLRI